MKNLVKIVFLMIAGGCFATIAWFTFINPVLSTNQFTIMVVAGMVHVGLIAFLYFKLKMYQADGLIDRE